MGSVIKKRRKRMAKKKHRKLLRKTRHQRRNKKSAARPTRRAIDSGPHVATSGPLVVRRDLALLWWIVRVPTRTIHHKSRPSTPRSTSDGDDGRREPRPG